jgi:hypothetical protein
MIRLLEFAPRYSIRSGIAQTIQSYLRGRATKSGATLTDTPLALA